MKKILSLILIFSVLTLSAQKKIMLPYKTGIYIPNVTTALNPQPGDTLVVPDVDSLINMNLANFSGTPEKPIVITWANPKRTTVGGYNAYGVSITNARYFKIVNFNIDCKMANGYALAIGNGCSDFTVENGTIQNSGAGFLIKWNPVDTTYAAPHTINNVTVRNVSIKNIGAEGFYFGHTRTGITNGLSPALIKNMVVENITVDGTGWDGGQFSSIDGLKAKNIKISNAALKKQSSQNSGLGVQAWVNGCDIDSISIENSEGGITILAKSDVILKNVSVKNCTLAAFYIDDYPADITWNPQRLLFTNVKVDGAGTYAFWDVNRNKTALPGTIINFTFSNTVNGILDNSKSQFLTVAPPPPPPTKTIFHKGYFTLNSARFYYVMYTDGTYVQTNSKYVPL